MGAFDKKKMTCNKPRYTPAGHSKKSVVKACQNGKEKIVTFGDPKMKIKKSSAAHRSSFRARHNCSTAKDKLSARYWSCRAW